MRQRHPLSALQISLRKCHPAMLLTIVYCVPCTSCTSSVRGNVSRRHPLYNHRRRHQMYHPAMLLFYPPSDHRQSTSPSAVPSCNATLPFVYDAICVMCKLCVSHCIQKAPSASHSTSPAQVSFSNATLPSSSDVCVMYKPYARQCGSKAPSASNSTSP